MENYDTPQLFGPRTWLSIGGERVGFIVDDADYGAGTYTANGDLLDIVEDKDAAKTLFGRWYSKRQSNDGSDASEPLVKVGTNGGQDAKLNGGNFHISEAPSLGADQVQAGSFFKGLDEDDVPRKAKGGGNGADPDVRSDWGGPIESAIASDIDTRTMAVTFFPDKSAQSQRCTTLALPQLAEQIRLESGPSKLELPWLKLMTFGDARSPEGCLRTNANVKEITGIEVEHDKGTVTFSDAIAALRKASIRCIVYTSPSYTPATKERWRVLLPVSNNLPPERRAILVARLNGLFGGKLANESFNLSQAYLYGSVNDNPNHRVEVIDGNFIDLRPDLDQGAIGKTPEGKDAGSLNGQVTGDQTAQVRTDAEIMTLLELSRKEGEWHKAMLSATASMVGRGWTNDQIYQATAPYCREGGGDPDVEEMVEGARAKWNIPNRSPEELKRRAEQIAENIRIGNGDDVLDLAVPLILTPEEMIARLVWIGFSGAVVDRVTFRIRKSDQAPAEYAASVYFPKEDEEVGEEESNAKKPKAKPKKPKPIPCLNIWMASRERTTVDVLAWVPGAPQFCHPPENFDNAQTAFNLWRGITPMPEYENWQGLAEPFVDHVGYLVPVESERQRFVQWLAHIIQHPEVLPHTAWLMVAEKSGIGRNWMASVLVRVLRGYVAGGVSLPELLDGGFNGRLSCKLLAIVDELREGPGSKRYERGQRVKSIINEENRQINPKYGVQSVQKNCCRWLMFSNFFDALPFDNDDRRVEIVANPTIRKTPEYYERLYGLLQDPAFIASVWWWLKTMDISSFKPGAHATMNEAKERALSEMMTDVDRAVCDFRDECKTGLASRKDIEAAAGPFNTVNATHLTHAITHAGMLNTGHRVKDAIGQRHPVVIVDKAQWTIKEVKDASGGTLLNAMGKPIKK